MHRDTQIGLAMSIVLIGFAAALCFPRESPHRVASLQLPGASSLDAAIDRLPVKAYTGLEARTTAPDLASAPAPTPPAPPEVTPASPPTPADPSPAGTASSPAAASDPPPIGPALASASVDPLPDLGLTLDAPPPEEFEELIHVVQSGDTLSGIAQQYLGSVARYPEIFDANRDLLETPNDLKLNMRLRIPRRAK